MPIDQLTDRQYPSIFERKLDLHRGICSRKCYLNHRITTFLHIITVESQGGCNQNFKKVVFTIEGFWAANTYIIKMHTLCAHFLDEWTFSKIDNFYLAKLLECPPPVLTPMISNKRDHQWIKVLSYWTGGVERSQIFRPASLVGRDNSTEIFINSNITVSLQ